MARHPAGRTFLFYFLIVLNFYLIYLLKFTQKVNLAFHNREHMAAEHRNSASQLGKLLGLAVPKGGRAQPQHGPKEHLQHHHDLISDQQKPCLGATRHSTAQISLARNSMASHREIIPVFRRFISPLMCPDCHTD